MPVLPNEAVYLDGNILAKDHDYFNIGSLNISPSQELMAYTIDTQGNEFDQLIIHRIDDGEIIFPNDHQNDNIGSPLIVSEELVWGADNSTLFYTKTDDL